MGKARDLARVIVDSGGLISANNLGNAVPADGSITNAKIASVAASKLTGQVPDANAPSGSIVQVVSVYNDTEYTYNLTGATWTDTSISASITPTSASNKILVLCSVNFQGNYGSDANAPVSARINRGGAVLTGKFGFHTVGINAENQNTNDFITFLDSPNTTSQRTYTIQLYATSSKAHYVNRTYGNGGGCSVITLLEVTP